MPEQIANGGADRGSRITRQSLRSYVAKTLPDEELIRRINQERAIAGSWVQRTIDELYEKLADPLNVDFGKIAEAPESSVEEES